MITPPERSPERDVAIDAMLPNVPFDGWTHLALRRGLADRGLSPDDADVLFPGGAPDMIEAFCDLADRRMEEDTTAITATRLSERVRAIIMQRLSRNRANKEAIRRAIAILALPRNARLAATCTARTVDTVWHAAGDRSADFTWYTKRLLLTVIYSATVLFWLHDTSEDDAPTLAFLDRRLAGIGQIPRLRRRLHHRVETIINRMRPA
jgi:ubiquinone biosynthesis protein COQ9